LTQKLASGEDLAMNQRVKIIRCEEFVRELLELRAIRDGQIVGVDVPYADVMSQPCDQQFNEQWVTACGQTMGMEMQFTNTIDQMYNQQAVNYNNTYTPQLQVPAAVAPPQYNKKWEVCWEWNKSGNCSKGAECEWEHPQMCNGNTCWEWSKKSTCSKGGDCGWEHPPVVVGYVNAAGEPVGNCQVCNEQVFAVFAVPATA